MPISVRTIYRYDVCIWSYTALYKYVYICVYVHTHAHIRAHTHICIYIYMYIHVYRWICLHICIQYSYILTYKHTVESHLQILLGHHRIPLVHRTCTCQNGNGWLWYNTFDRNSESCGGQNHCEFSHLSTSKILNDMDNLCMWMYRIYIYICILRIYITYLYYVYIYIIYMYIYI